MEQLSFRYSVPPAVRDRLYSVDNLGSLKNSWSLRFGCFFNRPFQVIFNDNTSTMISSSMQGGKLQLRLHHMFLEARDMDLRALASYLRGSRRGAARLDRFIEQNMNKIKRKLAGDGRGDTYDLRIVRDALNRVYFNPPLKDVTVVWGVKSNTQRRCSIRLGSYAFDDRVVRIHPVLDQQFVPAYVVVSVVYHEMLHHALGMSYRNGKRLLHSKEFRLQEKKYIYHALAEEWIKKNMTKLLKRPRSR